MESKTSFIIPAGLLLAAFFVPTVQWDGFTMSGLDFVLSSHTPEIKYIMLVIPICAIFLLLGSLIEGIGISAKSILLWLPMAVLTILFVILFANAESRDSLGSYNPFTVFSLGFWVTLGASLMLVNLKREHSSHKYI